MNTSNPWDEDLQLVNDLLAARYAGLHLHENLRYHFLLELEPFQRLREKLPKNCQLQWADSTLLTLEVRRK